ncbi:MAG: hypothetical protein LM558_01670 [Thermosphaera sp.]|nr:hypothetical protein [Thermosphaera sp.]
MKVVKGNRVEVYNEKGELVQEREATLEDVKELVVKELIEILTAEYDLEITIDIRSGRGVARWRKKQS